MTASKGRKGRKSAGDAEVDRRLARLTRRGFVTMGVTAAAGYAGWRWLDSRPTEGGLPWPLRRAHEANRALWERLYDPDRTVPTYPPSRIQSLRVNGGHGLREALDRDAWRLRVAGMAGGAAAALTLAEVMALPAVDLITELRCIEGWSRIVHWTGVRFADFIAAYPPPTVDGTPPDPRRRPDLLVPYVGLETPDRDYYVGLDMASALHSQTLLAWALNGEPLTRGHGAPLRLVVPIKYGIKSLKRIGTIRYASERPADYWAERGYDWYSGH
ncbi:MAG: molybdopterin-dependent oxidoreductase [Thermoanaerobaculia bacterium]